MEGIKTWFLESVSDFNSLETELFCVLYFGSTVMQQSPIKMGLPQLYFLKVLCKNNNSQNKADRKIF